VRRLLAAVAGLALLVAPGCGSSSSPWAGAPPADAGELAAKLSAADRAWRQAAASWTKGGIPGTEPPPTLTGPGEYVERALDLLSRRPGLAAATVRRLRGPLAGQTRELTAALRDLHRLSAGWAGPGGGIELAMPAPLDELLRSYREAERRFGVDWHVLASINLVESSFGRARNASSAGAKGPMQFIASTWRSYGLGGNVFDPHDAIIGAANYLHASGAPTDYGSALFSYNRSRLYVDAVQRYARLIAADRSTLFLLYSWPTP
jgi:soluble lytic murein transglycosylase-like protein